MLGLITVLTDLFLKSGSLNIGTLIDFPGVVVLTFFNTPGEFSLSCLLHYRMYVYDPVLFYHTVLLILMLSS